MNDAVLDPVRHNSWATERLIEFCSELPSSQLETSSEGTYGSIASTLGHIVGAEGRYRLRLSGTARHISGVFMYSSWKMTPKKSQSLNEMPTVPQ